MSITRTLGGDRLGSGKKNRVSMHGYERSTHDLSELWRSTMAPGTLVPFLKKIALPGDTWDIQLGAVINTHPTNGPLFGSKKLQLDIFVCPIRLYQAYLHNNALKIGLKMETVWLPTITLPAQPPTIDTTDYDNFQINPSCILNYLGIKGVGMPDINGRSRDFQALPLLMYWDIYKNYYANKQEEIGAVIHTPSPAIINTVVGITAETTAGTVDILQSPATNPYTPQNTDVIHIQYTGTPPDVTQIIFNTNDGPYDGSQLAGSGNWYDTGLELTASVLINLIQKGIIIYNWQYQTATNPRQNPPQVVTFPLENLDNMRDALISIVNPAAPFNINTDAPMEPYKWLYEAPNGIPNIISSQEGLGLKTYQSDLFNNWISTEWIDGPGGISEISAIDITAAGGLLKMDALNLAQKVYNMFNRIAVSGGTYDDYLDVQYGENRYVRCTTPMYMGGLSKEIVFQEVISTAASEGQDLGTLGGRGTLNGKHKGGTVTIKVDEPSYIIGIVSITPRIDYSQGNDWDTYALTTMADLHVPALDEIGFEDLITEQMHFATTEYVPAQNKWVQKAAGKQPAWINYMTSVNKTYGNFAIQSNEMFMTLNRRYSLDTTTNEIADLTTYIDPSKYNYIFAQTSLDAQNYWVQIAKEITLRRKISARLIPNL